MYRRIPGISDFNSARSLPSKNLLAVSQADWISATAVFVASQMAPLAHPRAHRAPRPQTDTETPTVHRTHAVHIASVLFG